MTLREAHLLTTHDIQFPFEFLPARRYASAVLAVIVCLSVCLSQVGAVQRWLNLESHKQNRTIAQGL